MLEKVIPREQNGRDSFGRYRAQARSAAMAALSILEGQEIDRVYCDLHDDFVIRINDENGISYIFYQVKTKEKQNHNWTVNEVLGLKKTIKDQSKQSTEEIKDSFVGKLLLHTVVFDECCNSVVFQTNIHNSDDVEELLADIGSGKFENKFTKVLIERFNDCFLNGIIQQLTPEEIKERLTKLRFETDVQHLKDGSDNFEPLARDKIFKFSEVDLDQTETKEILIKLLDLVERKSSGKIKELTSKSIEEYAGISIVDLLSVLSISKEAYAILIEGGDSKAIKSVSIIQRVLSSSGAGVEMVEYCSRCKTEWDLWLRKNRHVISELDLNTISLKIRSLLNDSQKHGNSISFSSLRIPIQGLVKELETENLLHDLTDNLILGGIFSEMVRGKS